MISNISNDTTLNYRITPFDESWFTVLEINVYSATEAWEKAVWSLWAIKTSQR